MTKTNLLSECPTWTANTKDAPEGVPKWSGNGSPPWLGDKVNVTMNSLGKGTVKGFFVLHGYLGIGIELDSPPKWYVEQNDGNLIARVFGNEMATDGVVLEVNVSEYRNGGELSDLGCDLVEDTVAALQIGQSARIVCGKKFTAHIDVKRTEQHTVITRGGYTMDPTRYTNHRHAGRMAWRLAELKLEHG